MRALLLCVVTQLACTCSRSMCERDPDCPVGQVCSDGRCVRREASDAWAVPSDAWAVRSDAWDAAADAWRPDARPDAPPDTPGDAGCPLPMRGAPPWRLDRVGGGAGCPSLELELRSAGLCELEVTEDESPVGTLRWRLGRFSGDVRDRSCTLEERLPRRVVLDCGLCEYEYESAL